MSFVAFAVRGDISDAPLSDGLSRDIELASNAAKLSLDAGMVPLVELDISQDGMHTASQSEDMLLDIAALLSDAFTKDSIPLHSVIVGASMATSGKDASVKAPADEVAERSVRAATTALPGALAGVVFLSDSQTPEESTENLNALARLEPLPWEIAFCFSRALHDPVLEAWKGNRENLAAAQAALNERLSLLSRADWAGYSKKMETL
jgi:fructose-bisphosphate aldolase class I